MLDLRLAKRHVASLDRPAGGVCGVLDESNALLLAHLDYIRIAPASVLVSTHSHGHLVPALAARYPEARVCHQMSGAPAYDPTAGFSLVGDLESLPLASGAFDLIVSDHALHWTNDRLVALQSYRRALKPGGLLLLVMPGVETLIELRDSFSEETEALHHFPDMHQVGDELVQAGWADPVVDMTTLTLHYEKIATLFADLSDLGYGNVHAGRSRGLWGRSRWARGLSRYDALRVSSCYPVTLELIFAHAWAPENNTMPPHAPVESQVHFHR